MYVLLWWHFFFFESIPMSKSPQHLRCISLALNLNLIKSETNYFFPLWKWRFWNNQSILYFSTLCVFIIYRCLANNYKTIALICSMTLSSWPPPFRFNHLCFYACLTWGVMLPYAHVVVYIYCLYHILSF